MDEHAKLTKALSTQAASALELTLRVQGPQQDPVLSRKQHALICIRYIKHSVCLPAGAQRPRARSHT